MADIIQLIVALASIVILAAAALHALVSTHRVDTPITNQPPRRNPSFDLTAEDPEAKA